MPPRERPETGSSRLVLLGTLGGPPPEPSATGIATALAVRDRVYVIDCGRGAVSQYVRAGLKLSRLRGLYVTHLHADHVCDLHDFFLLGGFGPNDAGDRVREPVPVYGPGPAGALPPGRPGAPVVCPDEPTPGTAALMRHQVAAFAYQTNLFMRYSNISDPRELMDVHEVEVPVVGASALGETAPDMEPFPVSDDGVVRVTATLVPHGPVFPSFAYRFDTPDGSVVFSGDTAASGNVERLAHGADVLVHEAIDLEAQRAAGTPPEVLAHLAESHTSVDEVGPLAERAGVSTLVLSHLMPTGVPTSTWYRRARRGFTGKVVIGKDLMELPLRA
ncbi:MBL fold metallo-hydrolase [Streptomyces cavernicola]|uniref:MBL fold metallo-hydrolase n=1 Tax=Streptomyces cavernicola TaxID=3043613 RepID=A0ABT6S5C5_9ACTN|nr:MBL fold metallo-hydrolase [Streptomyces sp. B-S-A6]MDI3403252.1 MBL fold metallo-hydrolase [Streptomyces sp. B-S-A6]